MADVRYQSLYGDFMNIFDLHYSLNVVKFENPLKYIADALIADDEISITMNIGDEKFTTKIEKEFILKETEIGQQLTRGCQRFQDYRDTHDVEMFTIRGEIVSLEYVNKLINVVLY